jgi:hypothetical protein
VVPGVQVERATVRTTWTPGAASARLCLGRWQTGWELPAHATNRPALADGAPAISEPERPRRRHALSVAALPRFPTHDTGPIHMWARVGAARAERAEGRSGARSGAGKRARRSGAQPGLDEVGKVLSRRDEVLAVVAPHMGTSAV